MDKTLQTELIDLLTHKNHGNLYDFLCNNYYQMSKEELKDFAKECIAMLYELNERLNYKLDKGLDNMTDLHKELLDNFKEYTFLLGE